MSYASIPYSTVNQSSISSSESSSCNFIEIMEQISSFQTLLLVFSEVPNQISVAST
jgi:hypothetical protein